MYFITWLEIWPYDMRELNSSLWMEIVTKIPMPCEESRKMLPPWWEWWDISAPYHHLMSNLLNFVFTFFSLLKNNIQTKKLQTKMLKYIMYIILYNYILVLLKLYWYPNKLFTHYSCCSVSECQCFYLPPVFNLRQIKKLRRTKRSSDHF